MNSFYEMLIGSRMRSIEWWDFWWQWAIWSPQITPSSTFCFFLYMRGMDDTRMF